MTNIRFSAFAIAALFSLGACSSPEVVQERKVNDADLSCAELRSQIAEAEEFEKKARDTRGVTGTNVAAAVFFWARLGHFLVYTFGVPVLRTGLFAVGVVCQVTLALAVIA